MNNILKFLFLIIFLIFIFRKKEKKYESFDNQYIYILQKEKIKKININNPFEKKLKNLEKPVIYIQGSVHGNEPAGTKTCFEIIKKNKKKIKNGTVILFPLPNPIGISLNIRSSNQYNYNDINRNFTENGLCNISKKIIKIINNSDFIIDLHEGYDFHLLNNNSIGSTLSSSSEIMNSYNHKIKDILNKNINVEYKKFSTITDNTCYIPNSLRCFCDKLNKNYLLVETSGQNNIQKIDIRTDQMKTIIFSLLKFLNVI